MNKSYRVVWNASTGTWSAASEFAKGRKKSSSRRILSALLALGVAAGGLVFADSASAQVTATNPAGTVSNICDIAIGNNSSTVGSPVGACATAIGNSATATGVFSNAIGYSAQAGGDYSSAIGPLAVASGIESNAIGFQAVASGQYSNAFGTQAVAGGMYSSAIGTQAVASGMFSSAIGPLAVATAGYSVALGSFSTTTADLTAAGYNPGSATLSGTASVENGEVSVGSAGAERRITNVAAGSAATDAVNVSQLQSEDAKVNQSGSTAAAALGGGSTYDATTGAISAPSYTIGGSTFTNVGGALTNIDGRVTQNTTDISTINNSLTTINGTLADAVQYDSPAHDSVTLGNAGTQVTVTNVAAGALSATSTDAINGSQLYGVSSSVASALGGGSTVNADGTVSVPSYTVGGTTVTSVGAAVTNIDDRVTQNTTNIAQNTSDITNLTTSLNDGTTGLVQQDATTRNITVAKDTDGTVVDFAGTAGSRVLTGVAAGAVNATSVDAINGGQLYGASSSVASALGGGSTVNADGTVSVPSYTVGGTTVTSVGAAVTNIDDRVTQNTTNIAQNTSDITNLTTSLNDGTTGLVQQDATTRNITVAKDTDGTVVDFAGTAGSRVLTGVAAGAVNATSVDAINGGQLYGASSSVASALGGGSTVNADGTVSVPSYTVGGTTVTSVGAAVTNLDGRVTQNTTNIAQNTTDITNVQNQLSSGSIGLVQQSAAGQNLTVGASTD
ncbi:adhesin, partial [Paraburkholderia aspalathi]|uniref:ESPR-type extended signal peptide-containing protein n=1 Tax=Paraburkholderia nemoris TaxID=2793076 RepID=UPI002279CD6E